MSLRLKLPRETEHAGHGLGIDIKILWWITGTLWLITVLWFAFDVNHAFDSTNISEGSVWLLALSGLIFVPLIVAGIVAVWGIILGIPSCLLIVNLALRKLPSQRRWIIAALITAVIFVGPPTVLNHREQQRLAAKYLAQDARAMPSLSGRAIELAEDHPIPSTWQLALSCSGQCLNLLTFGKVRSVTRSFPRSAGPNRTGPFSQSFQLASRNAGCNGEAFESHCAKIVEASVPSDRLVLKVATVEPEPADAKLVVIRRLTLQDMKVPGAPVSAFTSFNSGKHYGLLNIAWDGRGFYLPRTSPPILAEDSLDASLYRRVIPNSLDGKYYPFR